MCDRLLCLSTHACCRVSVSHQLTHLVGPLVEVGGPLDLDSEAWRRPHALGGHLVHSPKLGRQGIGLSRNVPRSQNGWCGCWRTAGRTDGAARLMVLDARLFICLLASSIRPAGPPAAVLKLASGLPLVPVLVVGYESAPPAPKRSSADIKHPPTTSHMQDPSEGPRPPLLPPLAPLHPPTSASFALPGSTTTKAPS